MLAPRAHTSTPITRCRVSTSIEAEAATRLFDEGWLKPALLR
jgi:hypothetical protein